MQRVLIVVLLSIAPCLGQGTWMGGSLRQQGPTSPNIIPLIDSQNHSDNITLGRSLQLSGNQLLGDMLIAAKNPTSFVSYNGADVINPTNGSLPLGGLVNNNSIVYDTSFLGHHNFDGSLFSNPNYLSPVFRITDGCSHPGPTCLWHIYQAGQGSSGVFTLTNTDTSLVAIGYSALEYVCVFSDITLHCKNAPGGNGGIFITTNLNTAGGGSSSTARDYGSTSFSLTDPQVSYTLGDTTTDNLATNGVTPTTTNTSTGAYTVGPVIADFELALPAASNAPEWLANHSYPYGSYVTHTLTSAEMLNGGVWANGLTVVPGDIIRAGVCAYKVNVGGTLPATGSGPVFLTTFPCNGSIYNEASGGAQWRGMNSDAKFIYQNLGSSGTSQSSGTFTWVHAPGTISTGCAITSGSFTLTCPSGISSSEIGQAISVSGAGKSGGTLYTTFRATSGTTQATLDIAASTMSASATLAYTGHPDQLTSTNADANGIVWSNMGPSYIPQSKSQRWNASGGTSSDTSYPGASWASKHVVAFSTNSYGNANVGYSGYSNDQGTGIWSLEYDAVTNIYHLLNTASGVWTDWICSGGTGYNCSGGTITPTVVGTLNLISTPGSMPTGQIRNVPAAGLNCPFYIHNNKVSRNGVHVVVVVQSWVYPRCNGINNFGTGGFLVWQTGIAFDANLSLQAAYDGLNHWAIGTDKIVAFNPSGVSGAFISIYDANNAYLQPQISTYLQPGVNVGGSTFPWGCSNSGGVNPQCTLGNVLDSHLSLVGDPGTDNTYACGTAFNLPTLGPAFNAWQNTEACWPLTPTFSSASIPGGQASQAPPLQYTKLFNTGTSLFFSVQYAISEVSQDRRFIFWSSDNGCATGSSTGVLPSVWTSGTYYQMLLKPITPMPTSICGYNWLNGTAYTTGALIDPLENTTSSGGVDDVFQALSSGTSGPHSNVVGGQPKCGTVSCPKTTNPPSLTPIAVTALTETGTTGSVTTASAGLQLNIGVQVTLAGFVPSGYNGTFPVDPSTTIGAGCPGTTCAKITAFKVSGLPSGLGTVTTLGTVTSQGDTYCDYTTPGSVTNFPANQNDYFNPLPVSGSYATTCSPGIVWADLGAQNQRGDVLGVQIGGHIAAHATINLSDGNTFSDSLTHTP